MSINSCLKLTSEEVNSRDRLVNHFIERYKTQYPKTSEEVLKNIVERKINNYIERVLEYEVSRRLSSLPSASKEDSREEITNEVRSQIFDHLLKAEALNKPIEDAYDIDFENPNFTVVSASSWDYSTEKPDLHRTVYLTRGKSTSRNIDSSKATGKLTVGKNKIEIPISGTKTVKKSNDIVEVSTAGDNFSKQFSAFNAKFKEGTVILGVDVSGKSVEEVYQKVVKKSKKNSAPNKDSVVNVNFYSGKIKPEKNTIFVFGSNPEGIHGAGAAKIAVEQFGAIYGQGEGLQGNAYAIPTKDLRVKENNSLRSISKEQIIENIKKLYEVAKQNPEKTFKIAYTNKEDETTLNGYTGAEMFSMFIEAGQVPNNIQFSESWSNQKQNLENYSYIQGYLPLWKEWAKQNPELIKQLWEKAQGKKLRDRFAKGQVSQARALEEILTEQFGEREIGIEEEQIQLNIDEWKKEIDEAFEQASQYKKINKNIENIRFASDLEDLSDTNMPKEIQEYIKEKLKNLNLYLYGKEMSETEREKNREKSILKDSYFRPFTIKKNKKNVTYFSAQHYYSVMEIESMIHAYKKAKDSAKGYEKELAEEYVKELENLLNSIEEASKRVLKYYSLGDKEKAWEYYDGYLVNDKSLMYLIEYSMNHLNYIQAREGDLVKDWRKNYYEKHGKDSQYAHKNKAIFESIALNEQTRDLVLKTGTRRIVSKGFITRRSQLFTAIRKALQTQDDNGIVSLTAADTYSINDILGRDLDYIADTIHDLKDSADWKVSSLAVKPQKNILVEFTPTQISEISQSFANALDFLLISTKTSPCELYNLEKERLLIQAREEKADQRIIEALENDTDSRLESMKKFTPQQWIDFYTTSSQDGLRTIIKYAYLAWLSPLNEQRISNEINELSAEGNLDVATIQKKVENWNVLREKLKNSEIFKEFLTLAKAKSNALKNTTWNDILQTDLSDNIEEDEEELALNPATADLMLNRNKRPTETMHKQISFVLSIIPMRDSKGNIVRTEIGTYKYYRANDIYYQLLDIVQNSDTYIENADVLMKVLEKNVEKKPFIQDILDWMQQDELVKSAIFTDLNKHFMTMSKYFSFYGKSYTININDSTFSTVQLFENRIMRGETRNPENTIFDTEGRVSTKDALRAFSKPYDAIHGEEIKPYSLEKEFNDGYSFTKKESLAPALEAVGIKVSESTLHSLQNNLSKEDKRALYRALKYIITKSKKQIEVTKDDSTMFANVEGQIVTQLYYKQYATIAKIISQFENIEVFESSTNFQRDGEFVQKSSHVNQSYMTQTHQQLNQLFTTGEKSQFLQDAEKHPGMQNCKDSYTGEEVAYDKISSTSTILDITTSPEFYEMAKNCHIGEVITTETLDEKSLEHTDEKTYIQHAINTFNTGVEDLYEISSETLVDSALYTLPPMADSGNHISVILPKISLTSEHTPEKSPYVQEGTKTGEEILQDKLINSVIAELRRISALDNPNSKIIHVQNLKDSGKNFVLIPTLNTPYIKNFLLDNFKKYQNGELSALHLQESIKFILFNTKITRDNTGNIIHDKGIIVKEIEDLWKFINKQQKNDITYLDKLTLADVKEYYLNQLVALNSYMNLMISDPAYYKMSKGTVAVDMVKRIKGIASQTMKGDISVLEEKDKTCNTLYVTIDEVTSEVNNYIDSIYGADTIAGRSLKKLWTKSFDLADGQGLLTQHGLICQMKMQGYDTAELENLIENIDRLSDAESPFHTQVFKPLHMRIVTDSKTGQRIPTYVKNAEFPALLLGKAFKENPKLKAILEYAEKNNIHKIQFASAVKVGGYNFINLSSKESIEKQVSDMETSGKGDVIHKLPWDGTGEIMSTAKDNTRLKLGIQVLKVPIAGLTSLHKDEIVGKVGNQNLNKKDYEDLYLSTLVEMLNRNNEKTEKIINDPKKLKEALISQANSTAKFAPEDLENFNMDENGKFLHHPSTPMMLKQMYDGYRSIFKHNCEISVPGKGMTQVSSIVTDKKLHTVWQSKVNLKFGKKEIKAGEDITFDKVEKYVSENTYINIMKDNFKLGNISVKHMEAVMSVPYPELIPFLMGTDGKFNTKKLPEYLRQSIAYRVPTEGNCSAFPFKITEIIPSTYGHMSIFPDDIVQITGSDFDVDKDYCFFKEASVKYSDKVYKKYEQYKKKHKDANSSFISSLNDWYIEQIQNPDSGITENDCIIIEHNPANKIKGPITSESLKDLNNKELTNLLSELMFSRFQSHDATKEMLNVSNYEEVKTLSDLVLKYDNLSEENKKKVLADIVQTRTKNNIDKNHKEKNVFLREFETGKKEIEEDSNVQEQPKSLYGIRNLFDLTDQNTQGMSSVGPFAILVSVLEQLEGAEIFINKGCQITIDGKKATNMAVTLDTLGMKTFKIAARYLAAMVDNSKDPRSRPLNINSKTLSVATAMLAMGYDMGIVTLFMSHPIVREITQRCSGDRLSKNDVKDFIQELNKTYKSNNPDSTELPYSLPTNPVLDTNNLLEDKIKGKASTLDNLNNVAGALYNIISVADSFSSIVLNTRFDKASASLSSESIWKTVYQRYRYNKLVKELADPKNAIYTQYMDEDGNKQGRPILLSDADDMYSNIISKHSSGDVVGILKDIIATELLGHSNDQSLDGNIAYPAIFKYMANTIPYDKMGKIFVEMSKNMQRIIEYFENKGYNGRIGKTNIGLSFAQVRDICKNYIRFKMTALPLFADIYEEDGITLKTSVQDQIFQFTSEFPKRFLSERNKIQNKYLNLRSNMLLNSINMGNATLFKNYPYKPLVDTSQGNHDTAKVTAIKNAWLELLQYTDIHGEPVEEVRELAKGLVKYALLTTGGYFTSQGIAKYIPNVVIESIEGYDKMFDNIINNEEMVGADMENFFIQSILNDPQNVGKDYYQNHEKYYGMGAITYDKNEDGTYTWYNSSEQTKYDISMLKNSDHVPEYIRIKDTLYIKLEDGETISKDGKFAVKYIKLECNVGDKGVFNVNANIEYSQGNLYNPDRKITKINYKYNNSNIETSLDVLHFQGSEIQVEGLDNIQGAEQKFTDYVSDVPYVEDSSETKEGKESLDAVWTSIFNDSNTSETEVDINNAADKYIQDNPDNINC